MLVYSYGFVYVCGTLHRALFDLLARTCTGLCLTSLLLGELSPVACWRMNWRAAWRACGHEKQRQHSGEHHTYTHLCTLLTFPQNHTRDTLSTAWWAPPVCQPECVGPLPYRARKGPCFLFRLREGKCNSVTLPHPFFPFSHTPLDHLSIALPLRGPSHIMWQRFATLRTDDGSIRLDFSNCTRTGSLAQWQNAALKTKTLGNSKSVGKQLFEERHQDAHLLPGPEEREEGYIVNIDL